MQIIFKAIATVFITFLLGCFLVALEKEIKKFKAIRKSVGQPISSKEVLIYVIVVAIPIILFALHKYNGAF